MSTKFPELWRYRELLYFFAWRDIKVRYKQAVLGVLWAILQPLFTMIVFTIFFGRLAGIPSDGVPYPLFCFAGLVPWTYFAGTLALGANSLVSNRQLITKVYFPRILLPLGTASSGLFDFAISSLFLGIMLAYYGVQPGWGLLAFPLLTVVMVILVTGVSMLFAAVSVRYRDVKYVIPFLVQLWLFVSPIIYPPSFVPEDFRWLLALNPMYGIIEGFRAALLPGRPFDGVAISVSLVIATIIFVAGAVYFRKTERDFADIV